MRHDQANNDQNAVIITHHNGVTSCTLNRPDKLNALNADMVEGLLQAMKDARSQRQPACGVSRGWPGVLCRV